MDACTKELYHIGIAPVVAIGDADDTLPLAEAPKKGGVSAIEITFRTRAVAEILRMLIREMPDMAVGAGAVVTKTQADAAIAADAKFIVSPGSQPVLAAYVREKGVAMCPGTATFGEVGQTMPSGLDTVKFFPAEQDDGLMVLKAFSAPYRNLHFIPTGGMTLENLQCCLALKQVSACDGTWPVKKEDIHAHAFETTTTCIRAAARIMPNFKVRYVGISSKDDAEAKQNASLIASIFDPDYIETPVFSFSDAVVEAMKYQGKSSLSYVVIGTGNVDHAEYYLVECGVRFDESTREVDSLGRNTSPCLEGEIGGPVFHLVED